MICTVAGGRLVRQDSFFFQDLDQMLLLQVPVVVCRSAHIGQEIRYYRVVLAERLTAAKLQARAEVGLLSTYSASKGQVSNSWMSIHGGWLAVIHDVFLLQLAIGLIPARGGRGRIEYLEGEGRWSEGGSGIK